MPISFSNVLAASILLRVALIVYSEWHDARSLVKYTDVDYRVFTDAARFILQPSLSNKAQGPLVQRLGSNLGDPYSRDTYRYTPILALLLTPNVLLHPSFGKYFFAACDVINGLIIHSLLVWHILPATKGQGREKQGLVPGTQNSAMLYSAVHLLNPMVFSISTRGSSESVLSLFVLLTLHAMFNQRWTTAAILLGLSAHWKIYPIIYGISCLGVIGNFDGHSRCNGPKGLKVWLRTLVNPQTIRFTLVSAGTFWVLGIICYAVWGYPFLFESYLYHLHRLDHRHNFSPYFYLTYLTYPTFKSIPAASNIDVFGSSLTSFLPQLVLSLGTGLLFNGAKYHLAFAWFVQTATFVVFNKVCTSQYFLWYLLFLPLLLPNLHMSRTKVLLCVSAWIGTQALWLSKAYTLEFHGKDVFLNLWARGLIYLVGNCWVLVEIMQSYKV